MQEDHPYHSAIAEDSRYKEPGGPETLPTFESLQMTMERALPYWQNVICPEIKAGKRVLVVAHGTSLRGIVKHVEGAQQTKLLLIQSIFSKTKDMKANVLSNLFLFILGLSESKIMKLNLPNGIPFLYDVDDDLKPVGAAKYLADENVVQEAMDNVASLKGKH
jgi:2,3-bisphosphoglycerate-dependent phosphoglycerate mutase